ncbi:SDR family NAD(P)-dependent oxidoreductase [Erythrobacter litoralis]|uniref:SDR family NAD(P)-dependent oxidoreductase n=1 Tax=Erythrobacter litoralis TaxID=39960 RepID=UPI0024353EAA|nr:SDR family NAD(P)-dependent oxidoreductase [Erythrobacter litoralis]
MTNSLDLEGQCTIVWGGAAGIGEATSRLLASRGAKVVIVGRKPEAGDALAEELCGEGLNAASVAGDVMSEESIIRVVDAANELFGTPSLSANIIGTAGFCDLLAMETQVWDDQLALNLRPMFLIGRTMVRRLKDEGKRGSLVFTGSIGGEQGAARHAAYGAAKAGMVALAKSMAVEWRKLGIRVNCVSPGPIATPRITPSDEMNALFERKLPAGRFGTPEEVAETIAFALSDAANFINGQNIIVDGGWMAVPPISADDNPNL